MMMQAIQQAQLAKSLAAPAAPADPAEMPAGARVRAFLEDVTTLHYCRTGGPPSLDDQVLNSDPGSACSACWQHPICGLDAASS